MRRMAELWKQKKETGMLTLKILLPVLAALAVWIYWGNHSLQTTKISIGSKKIPTSFDGFTIVQISDLHNAEFGNNQNKLLAAIKDASPDLIAITGDLIDARHTDRKKALALIHGAVKIAPVYYVTGNHEARLDEFPLLEKKMSAAGVVLLRNETTTITKRKSLIRLLGVDDPCFKTKGDLTKNTSAIVASALKQLMLEDGAYTILLSHRPELIDVYEANHVDLALCGHVHGGQIRLPFVGGIASPYRSLFPKYQNGLYKKGPTQMVVSRGLGNSLAPVRINNRPELVVITLKAI